MIDDNVLLTLPDDLTTAKLSDFYIGSNKEDINIGLKFYCKSFHNNHYRAYTIKDKHFSLEAVKPWTKVRKCWIHKQPKKDKIVISEDKLLF